MLNTLMPDWNTIKSLLRAYAQLQGPLFKTHAAHDAQDAARPYLDQQLQTTALYLDAYRLEPQTQEGLGKIAGAAKGLVMMLGPGAVDMSYSILVRDPISAGKLLAQEGINLTHSVTAQFSGFVLEWMGEANPAATGTPFMQGVAKGEWAVAVASIVRGGMCVARGGIPPRPQTMVVPQFASATGGVAAVSQVTIPQIPSPPTLMMVATSVPHEAVSGGGAGGGGKSSKRPDKIALLRFFRESGNNVIALAGRLGVHRYTIYNWFEELGLKDQLPLRERRTISAKAAVRTIFSNEEFPALYVRLHYNAKAVADHCGITPAAVHARINAILCNGSSPARHFFEVQRKVVDATTYTIDHYRTVLSAHATNFRRSATFMGVSPRFFVSKFPLRDVEIAIADALHRHHKVRERVAGELGLSVDTIDRYINTATGDSPLMPYKRSHVDRNTLLADLAATNGNLAQVAAMHGTTVQNLSQRLKLAKQSGVEAAAGIRPQTGRPATFTDEAMAAAMKTANGNRHKAAKLLGVKWSALCRRWKLYNISDGAMLAALRQSDFNVYVAAKNLKIHPNDIRARIRKPDSSLGQRVQILKSGDVAPKTKPPVTQ